MKTHKEVKDYLKSNGFESEEDLRDFIHNKHSFEWQYWARLDGDDSEEKASILWGEWDDNATNKEYLKGWHDGIEYAKNTNILQENWIRKLEIAYGCLIGSHTHNLTPAQQFKIIIHDMKSLFITQSDMGIK